MGSQWKCRWSIPISRGCLRAAGDAQADLNRAVATATGKTALTILRQGFGFVDFKTSSLNNNGFSMMPASSKIGFAQGHFLHAAP